MLKKIDLLLIRIFIPPFLIAFVVALFVLTIQLLWLWLDELVGKGIGGWVVAELIFYLLLVFVPMALPIGVLISSVMLFGGLSERYELSSLKSAGVPLLRIMAPLIGLTFFVSLFSFFCSNNFIPVANLKSQTRLFDIKKQKPALNIEPGVFNDVFPGFAIRVAKKAEDNQHIEDIIIYEDQSGNNGRVSIIRARKGVMYVSEDDRFFVMDLIDGQQYQELPASNGSNVAVPPFIRSSFKTYNKVFDLSAFAFSNTNESLFKSNQSMLSSRQLVHSIDSISQKIDGISDELRRDLARNMLMRDTSNTDSAGRVILPGLGSPAIGQENNPGGRFRPPRPIPPEEELRDSAQAQWAGEGNRIKATRSIPTREATPGSGLDTLHSETLPEAGPLVLNWYPTGRRAFILDQAKSEVRNIISRAQVADRYLESELIVRSKHQLELHQKFSLALICMIFLFIGAPMGAIVRKGGFGYPLLVAIIFFVFFIFLTIFCKKLVSTLTIHGIVAAWLPCMIMFPIGLFLTVKAMNDSSLLQMEGIKRFFSFFRFRKKAVRS